MNFKFRGGCMKAGEGMLLHKKHGVQFRFLKIFHGKCGLWRWGGCRG